MIRRRRGSNVSIFLDSGAFSAFTKGVQINIQDYIDFIKSNLTCIEVYANLDVIGDAEATLKNQKIMEEQGLGPLPVFHQGEDYKYLYHYLNNYNYIALGGLVLRDRLILVSHLDRCFEIICDHPERTPKVKVHGFGLTSFDLMIRYPWYSVDSTSWVLTSRMGSVYVPKRRNGQWDYSDDAWKVVVSSRSPAKEDDGKHLDTFPPMAQDLIFSYFKEKGFALGQSDFHMEDSGYKLRDNERWFGPAKDGKREVETAVEPGLCNSYKDRDRLNIIYFLDLEKSMPPWPWPWKRPSGKRGFGL